MKKIIVIFDDEKSETVEVKTSKYILYKKMAGFVNKFEKLFNEYTENITPEIIKNAPDDIEKLDKVMDAEIDIQDAFSELLNSINDICFETVERAYNG